MEVITNLNIKLELCSYEQSLELMKKGFNEYCYKVFCGDSKDLDSIEVVDLKSYHGVNYIGYCRNIDISNSDSKWIYPEDTLCTAPYQALAFEWLKDSKYIYWMINPDNSHFIVKNTLKKMTIDSKSISWFKPSSFEDSRRTILDVVLGLKNMK